MSRFTRRYTIFFLISSILYGLAIYFIPGLKTFLHLGENEFVDRWVLIICGVLLMHQLIRLYMERYDNIILIICVFASIIVHIVFYNYVGNKDTSYIAYALIFILSGIFLIEQLGSSVLHKLKIIYKPILFNTQKKTVPMIIMLVLIFFTAIPLSRASTLYDMLFVEVDHVAFVAKEETHLFEEFSSVSKKFQGTVYLKNGKSYRIKLSLVKTDDSYNILSLGDQTINYTYRNYSGTVTISNNVTDDILYISNEEDLKPYRDGEYNYVIDAESDIIVYFDSINFQADITTGSKITRIYLCDNSSVNNTGRIKLTTEADEVYIYLNNVKISSSNVFNAQANINIIAYGDNYINGTVYAGGDVTIESHGKISISNTHMTGITIIADNVNIRGAGRTEVYGFNGPSGYNGTWAGDDGQDGDDGREAIYASEKVSIKSSDVTIQGGNAGNGGNGADNNNFLGTAGNGGNGGNGASGIVAKEVSINRKVVVKGGTGGKPGAKGAAKWGIGGYDGKYGQDGSPIWYLK